MITYPEFTRRNDKDTFSDPKIEAMTFPVRIKIYSHSFFAFRVACDDAERK